MFATNPLKYIETELRLPLWCTGLGMCEDCEQFLASHVLAEVLGRGLVLMIVAPAQGW